MPRKPSRIAKSSAFPREGKVSQVPRVRHRFIGSKKADWLNNAPYWVMPDLVTRLEDEYPHCFGPVDRPEEYMGSFSVCDAAQRHAFVIRKAREAFRHIVDDIENDDQLFEAHMHYPQLKLGGLAAIEFCVCAVTLRYSLACVLEPVLGFEI